MVLVSRLDREQSCNEPRLFSVQFDVGNITFLGDRTTSRDNHIDRTYSGDSSSLETATSQQTKLVSISMRSRWLVLATRQTTPWTLLFSRTFRRFQSTISAFIALGSNDGNTIKNMETACNELDKAGLRVLRTSHLYETEPMYYHDQAKFINGACEIEVQDAIPPLDLLAKVKQIEESLGRRKVIEKGPRNIDLDILLYGDHVLESDTLSIPHRSMLEREFVLRPLCESVFRIPRIELLLTLLA